MFNAILQLGTQRHFDAMKRHSPSLCASHRFTSAALQQYEPYTYLECGN
jgi:hypothetical protein